MMRCISRSSNVYGRDVALEENGTFTDQGYVRDTRDTFHEYYDGERGSIPEEYRVMTFQDDLPEEEKSEWAMDIAFDMDEFFRQNDPQYAVEHPEAHAAKEELYESLMAGRISALDEKLAALGQTREDYLPSEIEKFKDATGYEEFLDFNPAEIKAALDDPTKSRVDEMLAAAERAEREYAAAAAAYVQTPADIVVQARAVQDQAAENSFSIYQLKGGNETLDYRFEPLDSIHRNGLSVKPENYELVYEAPLTAKDDLESIYTRFNVDRPADFTGHSLSVSDIVVLNQDGKNTAHYCDSPSWRRFQTMPLWISHPRFSPRSCGEKTDIFDTFRYAPIEKAETRPSVYPLAAPPLLFLLISRPRWDCPLPPRSQSHPSPRR